MSFPSGLHPQSKSLAAADSFVSILAVTPQREIVLVEQFRIPVQRRAIEIPAGIVGDEEEHLGESLAACAARELLEETGYRVGQTSEFVHLFHATELHREHQGGGVAGEEIVVHHAPLDGLRDWLRERETEGTAIDFKIHAALWLAGY